MFTRIKRFFTLAKPTLTFTTHDIGSPTGDFCTYRAFTTPTAKATWVTHDGAQFLKLPAVIIKPGELKNVTYSANVVAASASNWDDHPVTVGHPKANGVDVPALHTEDTAQQYVVGFLTNTRYVPTTEALVSDLMLSKAAFDTKGYADVLVALENSTVPMEVSTGLFSANTLTAAGGHVSTHITPDHLALLPSQEGECSVVDGCGTLRNHQKPGLVQRMLRLFKTHNQNSFERIREQLSGLVEKETAEDKWAYVVDVYVDPNWFVYELDGEYTRRDYSISSTGVVSLGDSTAAVIRRVSYDLKESAIMVNEKTCVCGGGGDTAPVTHASDPRIEALIASQTQLTATVTELVNHNSAQEKQKLLASAAETLGLDATKITGLDTATVEYLLANHEANKKAGVNTSYAANSGSGAPPAEGNTHGITLFSEAK